MYLIIDRIEGALAVCETASGEMITIELLELPLGTKEGTRIKKTDSGYVIVTSRIKKKIQSLMSELFD